jgi:diguanylate cyclase (GGDEF)-like protein
VLTKDQPTAGTTATIGSSGELAPGKARKGTDGEVSGDETTSDQDHTSSDLDQTGSDQDQTWSDHDQTASDRDQRSADEDQLASDDDLAAGGDPVAHDRTAAARERTTHDRDAVSALRDEGAEARLQTADDRDRAAARRDRGAEARDALARMHDQQSGADASPADIVLRAERDRARAAADRVKAANDRARAAADREEAARERAEALRHRDESAEDLRRATTDELTGARTRTFGLDEITRELERAHRTGGTLLLAFVDVDGLKEVNDTQGHLAGDALLRLVGETIRANVRPYDLIVRYGGDELVCAMPNLSALEARTRFQKIAAALTAVSPDHSITFGLAAAEPAENLQELLARADTDLLAARRVDKS